MLDVPKIYVINLKHRTDRLQSITTELERMGLMDKVEIVEGSVIVAHGHANAGIAESHRKCIEKAMAEGYERIMILEDDCKFVVSKEDFENAINNFLRDAPSDWAGFWFGTLATYYPNDEPVNFVKPYTFNQDTGTLINKWYYQTMLDYYSVCREKFIETGSETYNTDILMNSKQEPYNLVEKDKIYVSKTQLCVQADNYSDRVFQNMLGGGGYFIPL
jgi:GR25 family glycosyltransferase involved in LPS biosynthesis